MAPVLYTAPPPYDSIYRADESAPLLKVSEVRRIGTGRTLLATIGTVLLALFVAQNAGMVRCPLNDVPAAEKAELRHKWSLERAAHQEEHQTWGKERAEHAAFLAAWEQERDAHSKELEEWAQQREEEARHRLELTRRSQGVYWTEPYGDAHCHSYGTRTYYAYLRDVPADLNWREVCYNMPPVSVHGRNLTDLSKFKCELNGRGEIVGTWYVNFAQPGCTTRWGSFDGMGCTPGKPGIRRYEARLYGVNDGDDANMMCATTPATIRGVHFEHPSSCEHRGIWWDKHLVGIWDYPDSWC
ncbi:hypothetical protein BV20DRAFT_18204 [Pilatotrama ljubarskyi]|nr:hypothetical protein BV20DRAFT_18204 [Pilatotrama ljubarskyi]